MLLKKKKKRNTIYPVIILLMWYVEIGLFIFQKTLMFSFNLIKKINITLSTKCIVSFFTDISQLDRSSTFASSMKCY